ncbi:helix-turn-helix domain-containing protein [Fournierella massiliensis]|nr:helix-turn-helix domain-containing protein [Fournierella massiliensis]MCF2556015.1 helix-turn-helix domain-containing protein [Fournierella massiliensis]
MDANSPDALPEKRTYTVEDIQVILGISRGTAYKLLEKKEFRWFKIGSTYRISKKSFDDWLDNMM